MRMQWAPTLPRWARIAVTVFGVANIVGALLLWSDMTLPGVVIGAAWTAVGLKGGLPLLLTWTDRAVSLPERVSEGVRSIRRRRLLAYLSALVWFPIAATVLPRTPKEFMATVFFLTALIPAGMLLPWALSACPRCEQHFFGLHKSPRLVAWWQSQCHNCKLRLDDVR